VAKRMRSGTGVFVLPSRLQKAMSAALSPHGDGALAWTPSVANRACAAARWIISKSEASGVGGVESKGEEGCCLPSNILDEARLGKSPSTSCFTSSGL
jgi:hypothetical protein